MIEEIIDNLKVQIYQNRELLGSDAARMVSKKIKYLLTRQDYVNIIFAAAASQNEFLAALAAEKSINWERINAFHMDEYIGIGRDHPQRFAYFLKHKLFSKVPLHSVHYLNDNDTDKGLVEECNRYANLLKQYPPDITCMGIGENTHLAFNDPHVANFEDPYLVKIVDLDEPCKQQQVNEGCFAELKQVPSYAFTLTVPALLQAKYVYCMVPGESKSNAVYHTLYENISKKFPSTSLRTHPEAVLLLDRDSAKKIIEKLPRFQES